jgi:hypothetical protein
MTMTQANQPAPDTESRVEQNLRPLLKRAENAIRLSARVAGTSQETAALFSAGTPPTSPPVIGSANYREDSEF